MGHGFEVDLDPSRFLRYAKVMLFFTLCNFSAFDGRFCVSNAPLAMKTQ